MAPRVDAFWMGRIVLFSAHFPNLITGGWEVEVALLGLCLFFASHGCNFCRGPFLFWGLRGCSGNLFKQAAIVSSDSVDALSTCAKGPLGLTNCFCS